jgi:hypothetical protein
MIEYCRHTCRVNHPEKITPINLPVRKSSVAISWDHLVTNATIECLDYKALRQGAEMCEYCAACQEAFNNESSTMMIHKQVENSVGMKVRLLYFRQHPQQQNNLQSLQIELDIDLGHRDPYFSKHGQTHFPQKYEELKKIKQTINGRFLQEL